jgi:1-acyl-sn-glycerol-3-phosphate acyltransferase
MHVFHWVLLSAGVALALYAMRRVVFWIAEGQRNLKPGYLTRTPTFFSRQLRVFCARIAVWWKIGRFHTEGEENLEYYGKLIWYGPHQTYRDALCIMRALGDRPVRYWVAINQAQGMFRAPLVAYTGGIVVHPGVMGGAVALRTAIKAMHNEPEAHFIAFPQGMLVPKNILKREEFIAGVVVLAVKTEDGSELPVAYLPFAIYYDRDPAHADAIQRLAMAIGWKGFRRWQDDTTVGAVLVLGNPVPPGAMSPDRDEAMDALFEQAVKLTARAEAIGKSGNY